MSKPLAVLKSVQVIDDQATGAEMRSRRKKAKLTLCTLADRLGVSQAFLSDLELGRKRWSEERAAQYVAALKA